MDIPSGRLQAVEDVVDEIRDLAEAMESVQAVVVVGSYAYGRPRPSSDVDVVIVSSSKDELVAARAFEEIAGGGGELVRMEAWGPLQEMRYRRGDGLLVEVGIVPTDWLNVPVDPGTRRVLSDGCAVVLDGNGLVESALKALELARVDWGSDHWRSKFA